MKNVILCLVFCLLFAGTAMADELESFLDELDRQAAADSGGFAESIGRYYGVPTREIQDVMQRTSRASDAFMIFELGKMTGLSRDRVMRTYEDRKGQGWGAMAQDMGIKPGSEEFHALKRGDFEYRRDHSGHGKGKDRDDDGSHGKGGKKSSSTQDELIPDGKGGGKDKKK